MKPVYEMAVMNVRRKYPLAQDARIISGDLRFRDTLKAALWRHYCDDAPPDEKPVMSGEFSIMWEQFWKPRFIPDLWWIEEETSTIHLFEIEDTHPLSSEKLALLHNFWWDMDSVYWQVRLTVFDRYGLNPRGLDLTEYAYHMVTVLNREKKKKT